MFAAIYLIITLVVTCIALYLIKVGKWKPNTNTTCLMNMIFPVTILTKLSFSKEPTLVIIYCVWVGIVFSCFLYHNLNNAHQYLKKKNFYKRLASKE